MNKKEIIKYCAKLPSTFEDYPFPDDNITVAMKHLESKKWFALLGDIYLNVKTDPNYSELLRNSYDYIIPAYHMNKEHWNTVIINDKVDVSLVEELIEQSYELTKK